MERNNMAAEDEVQSEQSGGETVAAEKQGSYDFPKKAKMSEPDKVVGYYVVLWRNESKQAAKCLGIDKEKGRVVYEMVSGPDKDRRYSAKYDDGQTVNVYDNESVILACLDA